jgi:hypothetical protein
MNELHNAARDYASRGLRVHPLWPPDAPAVAHLEPKDRGKRPLLHAWQEKATTSPGIIDSWWHVDNYGIGIATGIESGVWVLDVDGPIGKASLVALEAEHGALPPTLEVITARGRHLYFATGNHAIKNSTSKIAPGLDARGGGGFAVAPPSQHGLGHRYAWKDNGVIDPAVAPPWLIERALGFTTASTPTPRPAGEWAGIIAGPIIEGTRDCALASIAGYLLRRYVDPWMTLEIIRLVNDARCQPALPDSDLVRIVGSIASKEIRRRGFGQ